MTRMRRLALGLAVLGVLVGAFAPAPGLAPLAQSKTLDDLMMDLNITPFDPQPAPPLTVKTLDGGPVTLADVKGRAVLVYFWATW